MALFMMCGIFLYRLFYAHVINYAQMEQPNFEEKRCFHSVFSLLAMCALEKRLIIMNLIHRIFASFKLVVLFLLQYMYTFVKLKHQESVLG